MSTSSASHTSEPVRPQVITVAVFSPSDVATERDAISLVVDQLNKVYRHCVLQLHRWESVPSGGIDGPQEHIAGHLPPFEALDIAIFVLWARYGTPDPKTALSGTESEYNAILAAARKHGSPVILTYQCTSPVSASEIDPDQLVRLRKFGVRLEENGLLKRYSDKNEFTTIVRDHIQQIVEKKTQPETKRAKAETESRALAESSSLLASILQAHARIATYIARTPIVRSKRLEQDLHCDRVYLKLESIQVTGSFKIRGAMNAVLLAHEAAERAGQKPPLKFITASAGNHGLGVAYGTSLLGHEATVFMPEGTPLTKRKAIERYTQNIRLQGKTFEETRSLAIEEARRHKCTFVHPYNDIDVIAGQGTLGVDICNNWEPGRARPDIVVIPVGGGGLLAGVGTAIRHYWPETRIIGVEALNMPSLTVAREAGRPIAVPSPSRTFADGIAVAEIGDRSYDILRHLVDDVWTVSEESMARAVVRLLEDVRTIAEGAGACGVAGLLDIHASAPQTIAGKSVLVIVSGGNLDTIALSKLIQRGLILGRRLAHFRFIARDEPGALSRITRDLGVMGVNVQDISQPRLSAYLAVGSTHVETIVETRDLAHVESLLQTLKEKGHNVELVID